MYLVISCGSKLFLFSESLVYLTSFSCRSVVQLVASWIKCLFSSVLVNKNTSEMFHNQLPQVDIFGFFHLKLNVFCHIVWIKRQSCLTRFISVLLVANNFWYYFKNINNVLTQLVDLYCIFHVWEEVSYHRLTGGGANVINYVKTTEEEEDGATNLETVARLPASPADPPSRDPTEQNPRKNGVHFRGLLLHAGSAAHGGAYFLRYLARKYTPRRH